MQFEWNNFATKTQQTFDTGGNTQQARLSSFEGECSVVKARAVDVRSETLHWIQSFDMSLECT